MRLSVSLLISFLTLIKNQTSKKVQLKTICIVEETKSLHVPTTNGTSRNINKKATIVTKSIIYTLTTYVVGTCNKDFVLAFSLK